MRRGLILAGVWLLFLAAAAHAAPESIREVLVRGAQRVEPDLILQKVKSRVGAPYDANQAREDIRAIYGLGYFRDVEVELDDEGRLTFVVAERSALRDWKTEGSEEIPKEDLDKAVTLKRRDILDEGKVEEGAKSIRDLYRDKGYYLAEVDAEVVPVSGGKNQVDVVYRISEGDKVKVKDVNLLGVRGVDAVAVRKQLSTTEAGLWSWLSGSGTFKEADLERDREVIRSYYLNQGYVEVKVLDPLVALTPDRRWLRIDIPVSEGESHRLGKVSFSGDLEFSEERLRETANLVEGRTFRSDDFRRAIQGLSDLYGDIGYAFADVDPTTNIDRAARTVSVDFRIRKGDLVRIGRIEARGNTKTRDRVLRREFRLAEGDLYNGTAIRKTRQKIENLGYFEKVSLTTHRRPGTDLVDVDVEVEEKPTGAFTVGAGYSSVDRIVGMASVSQRNFLGLGYQLSLSANFGSQRETYSLTFNNPRVLDTDVYLGGDVYKSLRSFTDYDKDAIGADAKIGFSLGDGWRTRTIYRWEKANVKNISTTSGLVLDQAGITVTSAVSQTLTYDTRDNPWEPHRGMLADASVEWAGSLFGGDAAYLKYDLEAARYFPLWWRHVFTLHSQAGFIQALEGRDIPVYERYYLGGMNSLRGFPSRSVGPTDEAGAVIGGDKVVLFNAEYLFPLIEQAKVRGVFFYDAGNAWEEGDSYFATELRTAAGFGIRWFSPLGPLRLEWGQNLAPRAGERRSRWEFSIGGFF